jgi:hypothetical protein
VSASDDRGWVSCAVTWKMPGLAEPRVKCASVWSKEDGTWKNGEQAHDPDHREKH